MLMAIPWSVRPHGRWRKQLDAYVDGELTPPEHARFDAHVASCARCARQVEDARALNAILRSMPEVPAPRSFRLTPEMANQARAASAPVARPSRVPLFVAQLATGVAVAALATVFAFDRLSSGSSSNGTLAAPRAASAPQSQAASGAAGAADSGGTKQALEAPSSTPADTPTPSPTPGVASPSAIGVTGAGLPSATPTTPLSPTPVAPATGPGPSATGESSPPAVPTAPPGAGTPPTPSPHEEAPFGPSGGNGSTTPLVPGLAQTPLAPATGTTSSGRSDWFVPTEAGLAGLAAIALITTIVLARRRRRN